MKLTEMQRQALRSAASISACEVSRVINKIHAENPDAFHHSGTLMQRVFFDEPVNAHCGNGFVMPLSESRVIDHSLAPVKGDRRAVSGGGEGLTLV